MKQMFEYPLGVGTSILTHNNLGDFRVGCFNVYRILKPLFIIPHISCILLPTAIAGESMPTGRIHRD